MRVKKVNDWLYLTAYGLYDRPKLVVLKGAPPEQVQFARDVDDSGLLAGVIFEADLSRPEEMLERL